MRGSIHLAVLAVLGARSIAVLAAPADPAPAAQAQRILDSSHAVYAGARIVEDRIEATVDDGGAEPHRSSLDVQLGPGHDVTLIGGDLGVASRADGFYVFRPDPGGVYWSGSAAASIEAGQAAAFGGEGSGLPTPAALVLRRTSRLSDLVAALSQGALTEVAVTSVLTTIVDGRELDVIEAKGEIGTVTVRFDGSSSFLLSASMHVSFPGENGEQRVIAELSFDPRAVPAEEFVPRFVVESRRRVDVPAEVIAASGPRVGQRVRDLSFEGLDGSPVSPAALAGRVVVLDFWATWCVPCRASGAQVEAVRRASANQGLKAAFFGINTLESGDASTRNARVTDWWSASEFGYETLLDRDDAAARALHIGNLPLVVVIDGRGTIAWSHVGYARGTDEELLAAIRAALAD